MMALEETGCKSCSLEVAMSILVSPMNKSLADLDWPWLLALSLESKFKGIGALLLATGLKGIILMRPINFGRLTELSLVGGRTLREDEDDDDDEGPFMVMEILSGRDMEDEESILMVEEPIPMVEDEALRNEGSLQKSGSDLDVFFVDLGYGCFL